MFNPAEYDEWYRTGFGRYSHGLEQELVLEMTGDVRGKKVLDLACGTGRYSVLFSKLGAEVTGVDGSGKMLEFAKERAERLGLGTRFLEAEAEKLPFGDSCFDLLVCVAGLEFFKDRRKAVSEMKRVVRTGGLIVVGAINKWSLYGFSRKLRAFSKKSSYQGARFLSILELKKLFGKIAWGSTIFAPSFFPEKLLGLFKRVEKTFSLLFKPFGAFLVAKKVCV